MYELHKDLENNVVVYATTFGISLEDGAYLAAGERDCVVFAGRDDRGVLHSALFYPKNTLAYVASFPEGQRRPAGIYYGSINGWEQGEKTNAVHEAPIHPCVRQEAVHWLRTGEAECIPF